MTDSSAQTPKPWTKSQGTIAANVNDVRKAAAINELLGKPADVLPSGEGDPVVPLAIGIFEALRTRLNPDLPIIQLRRAVSAYARSKNYLLASAQPDAMRHDIDGKPVGPVSPEDRLAAQLRVTEIRQQRRRWSGAGSGPGRLKSTTAPFGLMNLA